MNDYIDMINDRFDTIFTQSEALFPTSARIGFNFTGNKTFLVLLDTIISKKLVPESETITEAAAKELELEDKS